MLINLHKNITGSGSNIIVQAPFDAKHSDF